MSPSNTNTLSRQRSYERLQLEADRLFDIGWLILRLTWEVRDRYISHERRPWQDFFRDLRTDHNLWFAWEMLHAHTKSLHKIIDWQSLSPNRDILVSQLQEEREQQIREFSRLMMSKRWDMLKDDDTSWRKFARTFFSLKDEREQTEPFFELVDYIFMLTLVILGKDGVYLSETTDYEATASTTPEETVEIPHPGAIETRAELKLFLKETWFDKFCVDKKRFNQDWREEFVNDLLDSEIGEKIIDEWTGRRNSKIRGAIIGCLKSAGVFKEDTSNLSIATYIIQMQQDNSLTEKDISKKSSTFSEYIGAFRKPEFKDLHHWVLDWVKNKQTED